MLLALRGIPSKNIHGIRIELEGIWNPITYRKNHSHQNNIIGAASCIDVYLLLDICLPSLTVEALQFQSSIHLVGELPRLL